MSEEAVFIASLRAGESAAYEKLVSDYRQRIFSTCYSFLKDRDLAEDQTQEVFISIFNSIRQFQEQSSLSTWIYRISISSCLDYLRAQQRHKRKSTGILSIFSVQDTLPAHNQMNPYQHLENKEYAKTIASALDKMPDKYKTAFVLKYMDALPQKEIAEIMEITEKAVEGILSRAKTTLREEIGNFFPEMRDGSK